MLDTTHLIGRYEILAEIGRGAMGIVYKAYDPKIDRTVAVKTILLFGLEPLQEKEYRERFYEEARAAGRLSHPGIVTIFDVEPNPENAKPYIVMEYVEGKSLSKLLGENGGRLPMGPALALGQEVAEALHLAHSQGVVHRDIKPENILVTPEGHAKIADFGIARLDQGHLTMPGGMMGSPAYMSPEQLNGEAGDSRSDLFSLGVVMYTMLTGHRPFQGNSTATICFKVANRDPLPISSWNLDFPAELDELVARAMAKNPEERFQTGIEMAREIQRFRDEHESEPRPLASIMRIIGQESGAPAKSEALENKPSTAYLQTSAPSAVISQKVETIAAAPVTAKKIARNVVAFKTRRPPLAKVAGAIAAAVLLVAGFAAWSKHKHSQEKELASSVAAKPAEAPLETAPVQSSTVADSTENQHVGRRQPTARSAARIPAAVGKTATPPIAHKVPAGSRATARPAPDALDAKADISNPQDSVTVQMIHLSDLTVTIEHSFEEAQASISVDNRTVYNQELHGEKKRRALVFSHTAGSQSSTINLLPGKHDIVVRVQSPANAYDATEKLTQTFSPGSNRTLLVKCDKHKNRLQLSIK
jgi:eukaryotic-like serine/threonine-protein kinase